MNSSMNNTILEDKYHYIMISLKVEIVSCIIAVLFNVLALIAMRIGVKELRAKHRFVISLNVAEMLVALTMLIMGLIELYKARLYGVDDIVTGLMYVGISAMGGSIVCAGFDLYIALCYSLRYGELMTPKRVNILLFIAWLSSVLCGMSYFLCPLQRIVKLDTDFCNTKSGKCLLFVGIFGTYNTVCFAFLFFFHLKVTWSIRRMSKLIQPLNTVAGSGRSGEQSANSESTKRAILTIWMVTLTMLLFLIPGYVVSLTTMGSSRYDNLKLYIATIWATFNCIADPIIYSCRMSELRSGYKKMFAFMKRT